MLTRFFLISQAGDESTMGSDTKEKSVVESDPDLLRAPRDTDTGMSPTAEVTRPHQYQAPVSSDTRGAGQRYDAVSLSDIGRVVHRSRDSEEAMQRTNQVRSEMTDPQSGRHDTAVRFGEHFPHSTGRRVSSSSNGGSYYGDSAYWSHAPFATSEHKSAHVDKDWFNSPL